MNISELVVRIGSDTKKSNVGLHKIQINIRQLELICLKHEIRQMKKDVARMENRLWVRVTDRIENTYKTMFGRKVK